jgi:hypothetical protein
MNPETLAEIAEAGVADICCQHGRHSYLGVVCSAPVQAVFLGGCFSHSGLPNTVRCLSLRTAKRIS